MRAMVISEFNKPWELRELADPRPAPGQVLIRVHASGMCGTDLHVHHGVFPLKPPIVAGHEADRRDRRAGRRRHRPARRRSRRRVLEPEGLWPLRRLPVGPPRPLPAGAELDEPGRRQLRADAGMGQRRRADPRRRVVRGGRADLLRRLHRDERPAQRRPAAGRAHRRARRRRARPPGGATGEGGRPRDRRAHRPGRQERGAARAGRRRGAGDRRRSRQRAARRGRRRRDPVDDQLGATDRGGDQGPAAERAPDQHGAARRPDRDRSHDAADGPAPDPRQQPGRAARSLRGAVVRRRAARSSRASRPTRWATPTPRAIAWRPARCATARCCSTRRASRRPPYSLL